MAEARFAISQKMEAVRIKTIDNPCHVVAHFLKLTEKPGSIRGTDEPIEQTGSAVVIGSETARPTREEF